MKSLSVFCLIVILSNSVVKCTSNVSVIIVGAGPAGIAAATKLLENSITNITVLEAENRIGGRVNSVRLGDGFVDVGAEYVHGMKGNIIYELAHEYLAPIAQDFKTRLFYSNGSQFDQEFTQEIQDTILEILGYSTYAPDYNVTGLSLGEFFVERYESTILKKYEKNPEKSRILKEVLLLAEKVSLMIDGAFSWKDTSVKKHYQRCEGHQLLVWQGHGSKTILELLMRSGPSSNPEDKLPIDRKIHLNKKVVEISWNQRGGGVSLQTEDGALYAAHYVIFTPSVGVLKLYPNLFNPPLPHSKRQAIDAIGIAGVLKLLLLFPNKWWRDDDTIFSCVWNAVDLQKSGDEFSEGPVRNGISWVSAITLFAVVPGNPRVLGVWVTGDFIPDIEHTDLDIVRNGTVYVLGKFLGNSYNISRPEEIIRSTWHTNANFRGTYSFDRAGFDTVPYHNHLAEPLPINADDHQNQKPVLLFAGEATNPIHYSTVHGAIETGHREAERIINLHREDNLI